MSHDHVGLFMVLFPRGLRFAARHTTRIARRVAGGNRPSILLLQYGRTNDASAGEMCFIDKQYFSPSAMVALYHCRRRTVTGKCNRRQGGVANGKRIRKLDRTNGDIAS